MKTVNIALYRIDELSQEAQGNAFEKYRLTRKIGWQKRHPLPMVGAVFLL